MKSIITSAFILFGLILSAQSGEITYTQKQQLNINLPEEHREMIGSLLSDINTLNWTLSFSSNEALFKNVSEEETVEHNETDVNGDEMQIRVRREPNESEYYTNLSELNYIHKRGILGKYFIISEEIKKPNWKLLPEQKDVLGQTCMKATLTNDEGHETIAWYTPSISLSYGPAQWGSLPGIILELNEGGPDGRSYVANSLNLDAQPAIEKPSGGKKMSLKKFEKLRADKLKEQELNGGGNMIIMRQERN